MLLMIDCLLGLVTLVVAIEPSPDPVKVAVMRLCS